MENDEKIGKQLRVTRPYNVIWNENTDVFELWHTRKKRLSTVTDFEDVSYAISPYMPEILDPRKHDHPSKRDIWRDLAERQEKLEEIAKLVSQILFLPSPPPHYE